MRQAQNSGMQSKRLHEFLLEDDGFIDLKGQESFNQTSAGYQSNCPDWPAHIQDKANHTES